MAWIDISDSDYARNLKWETAGIDPEWVGGIYKTESGVKIVTFKEEYFKEVTAANKKLALESGILGANQVDTNVPKLPSDQLEYLRHNYSPRSMSKEEYDAFLEDLFRFGVITEQEKRYLNFTNCWLTSLGGITIMPDTFMEPPYNFESCGGNVYELARFHSQVERLPSYGYGSFKDAQALSFGKLLKVFNQMGVR